VRDAVNDRGFSNSPRHLSKVGVQIPVAGFYVGIEGQYAGERLSLGGVPVDGAFVPNVTLSSPAGRRFDVSIGMYNALDMDYADPGAEEHIQQSIPQDGRRVLARVRVRF
jgi:iron complex outermembrane receptor protein